MNRKPADYMQEYRDSRVRASSLQLDQAYRVRDEMEMSRPQRKNPVTTLLNVALIAAAAGIATALCRELQVGLNKNPMYVSHEVHDSLHAALASSQKPHNGLFRYAKSCTVRLLICCDGQKRHRARSAGKQ